MLCLAAPEQPQQGITGEDIGAAAGASLLLDDRERALVALLVAGHTDSSAARRLSISPRTVTNVLRSLMDRLGVDNRFQLGVAIGIGAARRLNR